MASFAESKAKLIYYVVRDLGGEVGASRDEFLEAARKRIFPKINKTVST